MHQRQVYQFYFVLGVFLLLALWLPFGFVMGGLIEEWGLLGLYAQLGHFFFVGTDTILPSLAMRPFTFLMPAIAYRLDSQSFLAWHLLLMLSLLLKSFAGAWLVHRLSKSFLLGVAAALLFVLYPADTMQMSLRSLHIDWAISLVLLGACLFSFVLDRTPSRKSYFLALSSSGLIVTGIGMYEASFAMLLVVPVYLFAAHSWRALPDVLIRRARLILVWLAGILLYAVYLLIVGRSGGSYQSSLIGGGTFLDVIQNSISKLFSIGALHLLIGGWIDSIRAVQVDSLRNGGYLFFWSSAFVFLPAIWWWRKEGRQGEVAFPNTSRTAMLKLLLGSAIMMLAGYLPYLFSLPHLSISQRTFLAGTPGAVLVWIGVLGLVFSLSRVLAAGMLWAAVFLGLQFQLIQFDHYQYLSKLQQGLLQNVAEEYQPREGATSIVVRDHSNLLGHTWMFLPENLSYGLAHILGRPAGPLEICRMPAGEWMCRDALGRTGRCREDNGQWTFSEAEQASGPGVLTPLAPKTIVWPAKDVVVVDAGKLSDEGALRFSSIRHPESSPTSKKFINAPPWPLEGIFWKSSYDSKYCYRWNFGDVWSLDLPIRGNGWREAEWSVSGLQKNASAWKTDRVATLIFDLLPQDAEYVLILKTTGNSSDTAWRELQIVLNGSPLTLSTLPSGRSAKFSGRLLKKYNNRVEFVSDTNPDFYGLSFMMDSVTISPLYETRDNGLFRSQPCD
jgi:hypothetical protein